MIGVGLGLIASFIMYTVFREPVIWCWRDGSVDIPEHAGAAGFGGTTRLLHSCAKSNES